MRVLFTAAGGLGHLRPLLPLATRAREAGHDVLLSGAATLAEFAVTQGFPYLPSGPDLIPSHTPLTVRSLAEEQRAIPDHFAGPLARARADDLLALARAWRPDVVVRDEMDFGAAVAAEVLDLPHVAVVVLGAGGFLVPEVAREPLEMLRSAFGLPAEDGMRMLHRHLTVTPFPPAFRDPGHPLLGRVVAYRSGRADQREHIGGRVYVTLGTILNTESGDLLRRLADAVATSDQVQQVLVTTGPGLAAWMPSSKKVVVRRYVPQEQALAPCAAVVSHAGSGTVLGAIEHGLPMVCLPLGADQPLTARRVAQLGMGLSLPADTSSARDVTTAVDTVLTDPSYAHAARRLQALLRALPDIATALEAIERLAE